VNLFRLLPEKDPKGGKNLAKVATECITRMKFIRRAEYTIRPAYCKMVLLPVQKKIVFIR